MNLEDPFLFFPPSGLRLSRFLSQVSQKDFWKLCPQKVWKEWTGWMVSKNFGPFISNFWGKGLPAKSGKNLGYIRKHPKGWIVSLIFYCWSTEILEIWPTPRWPGCPDQEFVKLLSYETERTHDSPIENVFDTSIQSYNSLISNQHRSTSCIASPRRCPTGQAVVTIGGALPVPWSQLDGDVLSHIIFQLMVKSSNFQLVVVIKKNNTSCHLGIEEVAIQTTNMYFQILGS